MDLSFDKKRTKARPVKTHIKGSLGRSVPRPLGRNTSMEKGINAKKSKYNHSNFEMATHVKSKPKGTRIKAIISKAIAAQMDIIATATIEKMSVFTHLEEAEGILEINS